MKDYNNDPVKQHYMRYFMGIAAFLSTIGAAAQEQLSVQNDKEKDDKSEIKIRFDNLTALNVDENNVDIFNAVFPQASASIQDTKGNRARFDMISGIVYSNQSWATVLVQFMAEFDKKLQNGDELFLKMGRENAQNDDVFYNSLDYASNAKDCEPFAYGAERWVLGYRHGDNFFEAGIIQDNGTGKYCFIVNPKQADFWGKAHLSILKNCGVEVVLEGAFRSGPQHQHGISAVTINTPKGIKIKSLIEHDFRENDTKALARLVYPNIKKGYNLIGELARYGKGQGVDLRLGLGSKGMQVYADYDTHKKQLQIGGSYFFGMEKYLRGGRKK